MQPAYLGIGWGASDIGVNRREKRPDGSVDPGTEPDRADRSRGRRAAL